MHSWIVRLNYEILSSKVRNCFATTKELSEQRTDSERANRRHAQVAVEPQVGTAALRLLRVDFAGYVIRAERLSQRSTGQSPSLVEKNSFRISGRLLPVGNDFAADFPVGETF